LAPVEILVASLLGKLLVLGCCLLVAVAVLWSAAPKFINFLKTVSGHSPSKPKLKPIHVVLGIYAIVFLPAIIWDGAQRKNSRIP
jgi:hypothetical protein